MLDTFNIQKEFQVIQDGCMRMRKIIITGKNTIAAPKTNPVYKQLIYKLFIQTDKLNSISVLFTQMQSNFNKVYWPQQKKTALIMHLQQYIKYSINQICDNGKIKVDVKACDIMYYGETAGKEMHQLENQVTMQNYWMLECLEFEDEFRSLTFRLQDQEQVFGLAHSVKKLCQREMLAIFYLSSYLVKCCQKMQEKNKSIQEISQVLKTQVSKLKNLYAVKGMKQKQEQYMDKDDQTEQIQKIKSYKFKYPSVIINLKDHSQKNMSKQQFLQQQILNFTQFAKENICYFNNLLYSACIQNEGFGFKSGLKLYDRSNKVALNRIKQKLLKKQIQRVAALKESHKQASPKNLHELIQTETEYMKTVLNSIYENLEQIPITITDLLRGKCLFNKVAHISNAARAIEIRIAEERIGGKRNIQLVEIDNRLKGLTQDLVFKIKIQQIVCQFQFVLMFNQAENEIHHKMYQLERSKILSEVSLLYQWNRKSIKLYFKLLKSIIQSDNIPRKQYYQEKFKNLADFIGVDLDTQQYKKNSSLQKQSRNIKQIKILKIMKNIKEYVSQQKVQKLNNGKTLRSLQYLLQAKKMQKALQLYNSQIESANQINIQKTVDKEKQKQNLFIKSCELNCLGSIYKNLTNNKQALRCYVQSLQIKKLIKGQKSMDYAQTLNNIGVAHVSLKQYNQALSQLKKSLQIKKQISGAQTIEYAQTLNNIGSVYDNMRKNQQSLKYYKESLAIRQKIKGKGSIEYAQTLNNIGLVYNNMGQQRQAINYLTKCLSIRQKIKGQNSMDCAQSYNNIGLVYKKIGEYQQALQNFERSHKIKEKIKGKDSVDCAQTLTNIALTYQSQKIKEKSLQYFRRSLQIYQKTKVKQQKQSQNIFNLSQKIKMLQGKSLIQNKISSCQQQQQQKKQQINNTISPALQKVQQKGNENDQKNDQKQNIQPQTDVQKSLQNMNTKQKKTIKLHEIVIGVDANANQNQNVFKENINSSNQKIKKIEQKDSQIYNKKVERIQDKNEHNNNQILNTEETQNVQKQPISFQI